MKQYPSIPSKIIYSTPIYAFDKLDGSNIRVEWTRKRGFHKFGRRNGLLDDSNPILKKSIPIFEDKYSDDLEKIFCKQGWDKTIAYVEFYGSNSFAGFHDESDDHTVTLFDVWVHKKGFVLPNHFLSLFKDVDIPNVVHRGKVNKEVEGNIRQSTLDGVTFEGVVCKGPGISFKIKTRAWLEKLKAVYSDQEFERLK